jgi:hypothetical protein
VLITLLNVPLACAENTPVAITTCFEFVQARERYLDASDDAKRRTEFSELANHWKHAIPKNHDDLEEPILRRIRDVTFAPLRRRPDCMEHLREMVRKPGGQVPGDLGVAAMVLADQPALEDLKALLEGYRECDPNSSALPDLGRELGRALGAVRKELSDTELVAEIVSLLRGNVDATANLEQAAAIDGLFRAGETQDALPPLERLLFGPDLDALRALKLLETCRLLLKLPDFDPAVAKRAHELARQGFEDVLSGKISGGDASMPGLSRASAQLKSAVGVLEVTATPADFDLLASCYDHPDACDILNMDGLQKLRLTLQRLRKQASPEQRAKLDQIFFAQLYKTGERLFELEESPMSDGEQRRFLGTRNQRYNAAAYFVSQWLDNPDVREPWRAAAGAADVLAALVHATEEQSEGEREQQVYRAVKEKLETRVLSARILAKLQAQSTKPITDLDLCAYFLSVMAEEIGAPYESVLKAFRVLESSRAEHLEVVVPKTRDPADYYVRDTAALGLQDIGYTVNITDRGLLIRVRRTAEKAED